jgi:hypothetical protein
LKAGPLNWPGRISVISYASTVPAALSSRYHRRQRLVFVRHSTLRALSDPSE